MEDVPPPAAAPKLQRIERPSDLDAIVFEDGLALVEVNADLLPLIRFKNDARADDPRLNEVTSWIRQEGYVSYAPIIARIGQKGKWVIVDGGHRLTAARKVMGELWTNFFRRKVQRLQFILFTTDRSWAKVRDLAGPGRPRSEAPLPKDAPTAD